MGKKKNITSYIHAGHIKTFDVNLYIAQLLLYFMEKHKENIENFFDRKQRVTRRP